MNCEIITIGDELLIGQVVDTNSAWMAQRLNERGIVLKQITSVHDDAEHITAALDEAFNRADIVLTTGGLGPTKDDITKKVLCDYFHTRLVPSKQVEEHVRKLYKNRPDVLNRLTATQWLVPENCTVLTNRVGSAPIMAFTLNAKRLISLPGVPHEMQVGMQEQVLPWLTEQLPDMAQTIAHRTLLVSGIAESSLAIILEKWENALPDCLHLAYLPKDGTIRLRLSLYEDAIDVLDEQWNQLKELVQDYLVVDEDKPLELVLGQMLLAKGQTISTAESCTGGRLAALLNAHSGSSAWYWGSVVAYDNSVKQNVLGVPADVLETHGAVSEETVRYMVEGVRNLAHTDYAIATSGIAGPTGGTPDKPVGTVWMAWATPDGTYAECFHLGSGREQITTRACTKALLGMIQILRKFG
ncbi:MAG: CinA family nicotinamide mononucleotide deamidase-related protein [Paludibacteraceae bacterium]|nr:CinA family nicotinamide mononucleotide deamidase-related protein [Paludibacteraceae bacterium]